MEKMDKDLQESQNLPYQHQQKLLFPISSFANTSKEISNQAGSLFPCVTSLVQCQKTSEVANLDWLTNQSYQASKSKLSVDADDDQDVTSDGNLTSSESDQKGHKKKSKDHRKRRRSDSESSTENRHKTKHKKKEKKKKKKHKRKELEQHLAKAHEKVKPDTIWIEESGLKPDEAYRIHRKKDIENLQYGSIYRLDVATYKIKSNLACLGLGKNQSVSLNETKKKKKKRTKEKDLRYWCDSALFTEEPKQLLPSKLASIKLFVGNIENFSYVPVDLPSKREDDDDDDNDDVEDNDSNIDPSERIIIKETAKLNKILRENPHDVKTWIDLANFQTKVINKKDSNTAAGNDRNKKRSKIVNEKQISVIEKALEQNPSSVELIIYHLDLCKDVWDDDRLIERWKQVVFSYPNKTTLWRKYLLFLQSRVSIFTVRKVQRAYEKCFAMLLSIKEGTFVSHQAEDNLEEDMFDLFVQYCKFLKQSGHTEKCVASFQAMIELNCLFPEELSNSTTSGSIEFLETFWDSGQPRFGEHGAVGWKTWMDKTTACKKPLAPENLDFKKIFKSCHSGNEAESSESSSEDELIKGQPKWKAWLNVEVNRETAQLKPWQPDHTKGETEEDCEDPERMVLFDDIKCCLFKINDTPSKVKLVMCFLESLGVFLSPLLSSNDLDTLRYFELSMESIEQILSPSDSSTGSIGWQKSGYWYSTEATTLNKPSIEALHLIRSVFAQSMALFESKNKNQFIIAWLYYEFYLFRLEKPGKTRKQRLKEVYKLAKAILKEPSNRNNFQIWEVFAKMTSFSGDVSESRHVFDSTLSMASQLQVSNKEKTLSLASLYRSYAEMELKQQADSATGNPSHQTRSLHILVSFAENTIYKPITESSQSISPAIILRAKRTFAQIYEESVNDLKEQTSEGRDACLARVHCIACCALFAYITSGINAAVGVYKDILSSLSSTVDAFHHELLWTDYINLVKMHTKQETMPLKTIKTVIHQAISAFPNNPMFLDYYLQVELKSNLTGEVRRFFDHLTQGATSPLPWLFAVCYEDMRAKAMLTARDCNEYTNYIKDRQPVDGQTRVNVEDIQSVDAGMARQPLCVTSLPTTGISHRQRALFDRATSSVIGRQCIALWRMYIGFELNHGNYEQAKAVFYQALQNCAWAKILYLDAVKAFPDDLQRTLDMMTEMEMRVRTPLEEIDILLEG